MYQNNYIILIYSLYVYNEIEKDEEPVDGGGKWWFWMCWDGD